MLCSVKRGTAVMRTAARRGASSDAGGQPLLDGIDDLLIKGIDAKTFVAGHASRPLSATARNRERKLSSKQERKTGPATNQEEEAAPDPEQSSISVDSAAEASRKAADKIDDIDEVLEEFDNLTLTELGFRKDDVVDPAKVDEAIERKVNGFVQKGGQ